NLLDGPEQVVIVASSAGFVSSTGTILVVDNDVHHFEFAPVPDRQTDGVPFSVTVAALDIDNAVVAGFNGTPVLGAQGRSGTLPVRSLTPFVFQEGTWTGMVAVAAHDAGVRLSATTNAARGESNPFETLVPTVR